MPPRTSDDGRPNSIVLGWRLLVAVGLGAAGLYGTFFGATASRVRTAVIHPKRDDGLNHILDNLIFVCSCIGFVGIFDLFIARFFAGGRLFALHFAVNAACVAFAWRDALATLVTANPFEANLCGRTGTSCSNKVPLNLTAAMHLWYSFAYASRLIDWVHHIPSHVVCAIGIIYPWGPVLNFSIIILMGVPGSIDNLLRTLTKAKLLQPRVEKNWNQSLHVWIRCPGCVVSAFIIVGGAWLHAELFSSAVHRFLHALVGVHHYCNGCFFMYRAVDRHTRHVIKHKAAKEGGKQF